MSALLNLQMVVGEEAAAKSVNKLSIMDIIIDSNAGIGWLINLGLLAMFGYVVFIFVERYTALRRASREEDDFLKKIKGYLVEGNIDAARKFCANSESPSARMLEKGINRLGKPMDNIAATIENSGKLEIMTLEQRVSFLATASGAGPMLGFLGTLAGLVMLFMDVEMAKTIDLKSISPGILTALITSVEGLMVGVIAYLGYNFLVARIGRIVYNMENTAIEFMDLLNEPGK
ncbi:MAG: MotA/TolQ/ExbB proton channel family protein [Flavobacteriia bacterium]|jgi:biopolymer transport protein ExbB|nr:MotA/TolQ/ExbB proton channel family protein [Flavobacteriia bacterium]